MSGSAKKAIIAGPVTAMALQRAGIEPVVYEAYATGAGTAGAFLTVAVNGLDALRVLDAHRPVLATGFPTKSIVIRSGSGKRLGEVPIGGRCRTAPLPTPSSALIYTRRCARRPFAAAFVSSTASGSSTPGLRPMVASSHPSKTVPKQVEICSSARTGSTPAPAP
jgi:hypothetical protein